MSLLYDKVISIVGKSAEERSEAEIEQILPWFRKKSELFKSQKSEIVKDILKNCQFMTCKRDYVVIKQGDKGDCFFIILNGSVAVHIHTTLSEEGILYEENKDDGDDDFLGNKKKKELDRSLFGNFVGRIPAGRSFGELALINADCVRNASIIADEVTDLLIVNRDLYNRSLKAFQEKEFNEKKNFVEEFHLFRGWQQRYKKQLAMSLRKEKITFDGIIVKQGCPLDGICFLLSGQAKMLMEPSQHEIQYPDQFPLPDIAELEKVEARESIRREMNMAVPKTDDRRSSAYRPRSPTLTDKRKSHKPVEVCVMGAYEIIGDLELTFGLNSYAETILCTQEAELFVLDYKNYERLIEKRNPQALDVMRDALHDKLKLRFTWIPGDDLPLCRYFIYKLDEKKRHELNRRREYNRKRDISGAIDYWKSGKLQNGPLIDQYGPGSVFYTIRMRSSKKGLLRNRGKPGAFGFGITRQFGGNRPPGAFLSRKPVTNEIKITVSDSDVKDSSTNHFNDNDPDQFDVSEDDDSYDDDDVTDGSPPISRSKVLCNDSKEHNGADSRTSKGGQKSRSDCSVDDFMDQELNELVLTRLETRIEAWHTKLNDHNTSKSAKAKAKHTVKLHRYNMEDHQKPLPGKKIILKPKVRNKPNLLTLRLEAMENANRPTSPTAFLTDNRSITRYSTEHREIDKLIGLGAERLAKRMSVERL